jgi:tetratricopeptide (TPR) repeat protein
MCASLMLTFAVAAQAQLKAGSEEDKAFQKISAEKSPDAQIPLLLNFEKSFPDSKVLPDVYLMLVDIYNSKQDTAKVAEYGEKAVKADPQNVSALVTVSRVYAMERKNLDVAVSYAQKAVDNVEKMKSQPAPSNYTDAEWKQLLKDNEEAAKGQLNYAKAVKQ